MQAYAVVFVGAGIGGCLRHAVNLAVGRWWSVSFPYGTLTVNVVGSFLMGALDTVRTHLVRIRRVARGNPVRLRAAAAEHLLILDAIIDGDAALAAHATHVHLHLSRASVLAVLGASEPAS